MKHKELYDAITDFRIKYYCMGTLQTPSSVTCKEDIEHEFSFDD